jgi:hypothetical protein
MYISKCAVALCAAIVMGLCATTQVDAGPVLSNTAALKSAADDPVTEVRFIRRGWARAAVATGIGLAVASSYAYGAGYPYYGYGTSYNYGYAPYNYGYAPATYSYGTAPYYGGYGYNYGYASGYYGYGARRVARGVARRAAFHR